MKKFLTTSVLIGMMIALTNNAVAEYLGSRLNSPLESSRPSDRWLVYNGTGDKAITATHRGDGFYSLDWDDRTQNGSVSGARLVSPASGFIALGDIKNSNCPNTWGTNNWSYGCKVKIKHGAGYETFLGHLVQGSVPFTDN
ncbi:MAG: hypothetical protein AAB221_08635, partial [Bacteroidota bacterium]